MFTPSPRLPKPGKWKPTIECGCDFWTLKTELEPEGCVELKIRGSEHKVFVQIGSTVHVVKNFEEFDPKLADVVAVLEERWRILNLLAEFV